MKRLLSLTTVLIGALALPAFGQTVISYNDFSSTSGLTLNGNASSVEGALQLTPSKPQQRGSAFTSTALAVSSFSTYFQFKISATDANDGGDGLTFVIQNSPDAQNALGEPGSGLGYQGITQSMAVEFDTYSGGEPVQTDHVGLDINGELFGPTVTATSAGYSLKSGAVLNAWIDYSQSTNLLEIRLATDSTRPMNALASNSVNLQSLVGGSAYIGFTAATGALHDRQEILNWQFTNTYAPYGLPAPSPSPDLTSVPEPSTYGLLGGAALAGVAFLRRRRRS